MKHAKVLLVFTVLLVSCSEQNTYLIKGTLPDEKYNGEYVFMLPFGTEKQHPVDSVQVEKKTFFFKGKTDSADIRTLRMRHLLRLDIQEHLIVIEPGTIRVHLDSVSSSGGTPQNDRLQEWKEARLRSHNTLHLLWTMSRAATDDSTRQQIKDLWNKENTAFKEYSRRFAEENRGTAVGKFVLQMTGP